MRNTNPLNEHIPDVHHMAAEEQSVNSRRDEGRELGHVGTDDDLDL
jgi:hypothetical protein